MPIMRVCIYIYISIPIEKNTDCDDHPGTDGNINNIATIAHKLWHNIVMEI